MNNTETRNIKVIDLLDSLELCLLKAAAANHDMVNGMFRYSEQKDIMEKKQEILLQYKEAQLHSMIVEDYCAKMAELLHLAQKEARGES